MSAQELELGLDRERYGQCSDPLSISVGHSPHLTTINAAERGQCQCGGTESSHPRTSLGEVT